MREWICAHCGERIVLVDYAMGPQWEHQPAGAAFADGRHQYCHLSVATPGPASDHRAVRAKVTIPASVPTTLTSRHNAGMPP